MADIKIYGKLVNKTDGIIADAEQVAYSPTSNIKSVVDDIKDDVSEINSKLATDYATKEELANVDVDLSAYSLKKDNITRSYSSLAAAEEDVGNLELGNIVSIKTDNVSTYTQDYSLYLVVESVSGKELKEIQGGSGGANAGTVTLHIDDIIIDGVEQEADQPFYECKLGAKITVKYTFYSEFNSTTRGSVFFYQGSSLISTEKVYPDGNTVNNWTAWDTSTLTPGTYTVSFYGSDSSGKRSERLMIKFRVGSLAITSTFKDSDAIPEGFGVRIPVNVVSAIENANIRVHVAMDSIDGVGLGLTWNDTAQGFEVYSSSIALGSSYITIPAAYITEGTHKLVLYLEDINNNKISNILEYNIIVAAMGKVYALTDKSLYEISEGAAARIFVRSIELGGEDIGYHGDLKIYDYNDDMIYSNNYSLIYGLNTIELIGIPYTHNDNVVVPEEGQTIFIEKEEIIGGVLSKTQVEYTYAGNGHLTDVSTGNDYLLTSGETVIIDGNQYNYDITNGIFESNIGYSRYRIVLEVSSDNNHTTTTECTLLVHENDYNIPTVDTDLNCWFKAEGMSNNSVNRDNWTDLSGNNVAAHFNNFNWKTNGWIADENGNTALTLNAGAYVELDITPFENEITDAMTISIDFSTEDILDSNAKVVSCLQESEGTDEVSYYLRDAFGDYVKMGDQNIIKYFKYAGGYCWIDGIKYPGDGIRTEDDELPYEVTYTPSERALNYNSGDDNPKYYSDLDLGEGEVLDPEKEIDYKKKKGTVTEVVTKQRGFFIDTEYAVLSSSSSLAAAEDKFHLNFSSGTRTRIDLIISRREDPDNKVYYFPAMIGYTNGNISSMQQIEGDINKYRDLFKQESPDGNLKFKVYLGCKAIYDSHGKLQISDTGSSKIYSFRIYNRALTPLEVLKNYAAEIPFNESIIVDGKSVNKKQFVIDANGLVDANTLAQLPKICLIGANVGGSSTINKFVMQLSNVNASAVSDLKAMKEPAYLTYTDPSKNEEDENGQPYGRWFIRAANGEKNYKIPIRLQFQGTSSMVYPMKNYKFKTYQSMEIAQGTGKVTYGSKQKFDIGNGIMENTFTIKADYMDSSHSNNTGCANFIADMNELTGETPANILNNKVRTTVYGYPVLIYYKENDEDTEKFLGVGNLNLDKSCTGSFGLDHNPKDTAGVKHEFGQVVYHDDAISQRVLKRMSYTPTENDELTNEDFLFFMNFEVVTGKLVRSKTLAPANGLGTTSVGTYYYYDGEELVQVNPSDAFNSSRTYYFYPPVAVKYNDQYFRLKNLVDEKEIKPYVMLEGQEAGKCVALLSEKGYVRSVNNDKVYAVTCSEVKANSGAAGAGGFGNDSVVSISADMELRYPDDGDMEKDEDGEYPLYLESSPSNPLTFKEFKSPWYYQMQRVIRWIIDSDRTTFVNELDKHFNRYYLMDYYLTILLLGGVDSLGKNLMFGTWGPENHLYERKSLDGDPYAFEYTQSDGNTIIVTPIVNKTVNGEYTYAKDSDGLLLYYDEDTFDRYNHVYKEGYNSITVTKVAGEAIWYPTFYDIDTVCGLDNSGQLIYDVDIEVGDALDDGTAVYNTADSHLWSKVRDYLGYRNADGGSLLSERWSYLRSTKHKSDSTDGFVKFSYDNLVGQFMYNNQILKIPEKYYNQDCITKYIWEGPFEPGTEIGRDSSNNPVLANPGSGAYLYCIHGSRYEQLKRWYKQRLDYLDSMFGLIGTTNASLRLNYHKYDANFQDDPDYYANIPELAIKYPDVYNYNGETGVLSTKDGSEISPVIFNFKTYQPGYVGVRWENGYSIHLTRVKRNKTATVMGNVKSAGDKEIFIFGGSNIKEIGDMYLFEVKKIDFKNLNKLNKLILGASGYSATSVIENIDITNNSYLAELNVIGCKSLSTLDVSTCVNLKKLDMTNSGVTSVSLPSGGALESISYSSKITAITLENLANLSSVSATDLDNLSAFVIKNCPKILGSKEVPNARAWALLQQTRNCSTLTNIDIESYGSVDPKILANGQTFFFPNKYYKYATAKKIRGEIYYTGTTIPEYYSEFEAAYPNLTITYDKITDASEMFANYRNISLIGTLEVSTGKDDYGEDTYTTVKYWKDTGRTLSGESLQDKWHTQEVYDRYSEFISEVYEPGVLFYKASANEYYRIVDLYDDDDLDLLRAEIKAHVSNFSKFTKVNGMFKNMAILDYLDPDTFNSVDLSNATTDQMFAGCTNLRYFEFPTDTVKNEPVYKYYDENGIEVSKSEWNSTTGTSQMVGYRSPFGDTLDDPSSPTSTHVKGIRNIGSQMFLNCKKARIFIHDLSGRITVAEDAFEHSCFSLTADSQKSGITLERPVICFEVSPETILRTTTETTSEFYDDLTTILTTYENPFAYTDENEVDHYFELNKYGDPILEPVTTKYRFTSGKYLREVYFNIRSLKINDETLDENLILSYAEDKDGKRILFDAVPKPGVSLTKFGNADVREFNNALNLRSISCSCFRHLGENVASIETVLPDYYCLDTVNPRFTNEKSFATFFVEGKNFDIEKASINIPESLKEVYIVDTKKIDDYTFYNADLIEIIAVDRNIESIGQYACAGCKALEQFLWNTKNTIYWDSAVNIQVKDIKDSAFQACESLVGFKIPPSIITEGNGDASSISHLGVGVFSDCIGLTTINYSRNLKQVPANTFSGCTSLANVGSNFSSDIRWFGQNAFADCKALNLINTERGIIFAGTDPNTNAPSTLNFDYFTDIEYIGDAAFRNCRGLRPTGNKYSLLKFPSTVTYIGESAFEIVTSEALGDDEQTEIFWDGDWDTDFTRLFIGSSAFANLRICWSPVGDSSEDIITDCVFIPKIGSIGVNAFRAYDVGSTFTACLAKNSQFEIGKSWVNFTKKIIFNYEGIETVLTGGDENSGFYGVYLLANRYIDELHSERVAYLQKVVGTTSTSFLIPRSITINEGTQDELSYKIIEILEGSFDSNKILLESQNVPVYGTLVRTAIMFLKFDANSELELIETNVLNRANSESLITISTGDDEDTLPVTLKIESGNTLKSTQWFTTKENTLKTSSGSRFIYLGKYIIGYAQTDNEYQYGYNLDLDESKLIYTDSAGSHYCNIIYDDAFNGSKCTSVTFNNHITEIGPRAFNNASINVTQINFPNNLQTIGAKAFSNCIIRRLVFPVSLQKIGSNAFSERDQATSKYGELEYVEFKYDCAATGSVASVQTEIINEITSDQFNVSLKTMLIPNSMSWVTTSSYKEFAQLSQVKLYVGNVYRNASTGEIEPQRNIPLYTNADNTEVTFDVTPYPYLDGEGHQIYCWKFYRELALDARDSQSYLETTEEYDPICPLSDTTYTNSLGETVELPGFSADLDISNIKKLSNWSYNENAQIYVDANNIPAPKDLTKEDILRIIAGFTKSGVNFYTLRLTQDQYDNIASNIKLLTGRRIILDKIAS